VAGEWHRAEHVHPTGFCATCCPGGGGLSGGLCRMCAYDPDGVDYDCDEPDGLFLDELTLYGDELRFMVRLPTGPWSDLTIAPTVRLPKFDYDRDRYEPARRDGVQPLSGPEWQTGEEALAVHYRSRPARVDRVLRLFYPKLPARKRPVRESDPLLWAR